MSLEKLLLQIEELRQQLHAISEGKDLTDPEVVSASKKLDVALNEYYRLLKDKSK